MNLDERLRGLAERSRDLLQYVNMQVQDIERDIEAAKRAWPADQMIPTSVADWHDRAEPTPDGVVIWATDGSRVWTIWGNGKPIAGSATAVKMWTRAFIPSPPANLQTIDHPMIAQGGVTRMGGDGEAGSEPKA